MRVGRLAPDQVRGRSRRWSSSQRIQLGGLRRQRGGEEGRDQEPDHPVRQVSQDEGDEDIVGVVGLRPAGRLRAAPSSPRRGPPRSRGAPRGPAARADGLGLATSPACRASSQRSIRSPLPAWASANRCSRACSRSPVSRRTPDFPGRLVEEDRRRLELIEDEHQHAEQQDEELHRDLEHGVEHQAEPALAQRRPREVALHLRLVGAEVRQREEEAAEQARTRRCSGGSRRARSRRRPAC